MSAESDIRELVDRWVVGINALDVDAAVAGRAEDIVMFDVPPPFAGVRGMAAYRDSWPPFFEWLSSGAVFELEELDVVAGDAVAFAYALLRCGKPEELAAQPELRLRVTLGLRKQADRWQVAHEHHSFPALD